MTIKSCQKIALVLFSLIFSSQSYAFPVLLSSATAFIGPGIWLIVSSLGVLTTRQKILKISFFSFFVLLFFYMSVLNEATIRNGSIARYDTQIILTDNKGLGINRVENGAQNIPKKDYFKVTNSPEITEYSGRIIGYKSDKLNKILKEDESRNIFISGEFIVLKNMLDKIPEEYKKRIFYVNQNTIKNILLKEVENYKIEKESIFKRLPGTWERTTKTVSENSKNYNIISIEDQFLFNRAIIKNMNHVNIGMMPYYNDDFFNELKLKINKEKPLVIINNAGINDYDLDIYQRFISKKLGIKKIVSSKDSRDLMKLSFRRDDPIVTPLYFDSRKFISPVEFYALHKKEKYSDSRVICFTESCMNTFGSISISAKNEGLFNFKSSLEIDLSNIDFKGRIFVSTENETSSVIASRIGYELSEGEMDFGGFLYGSGLYMGDIRISHENGNIVSTNERFFIGQSIIELINKINIKDKIEVNSVYLIIVFLIIGLISSLNNKAFKILGIILSVFVFSAVKISEESLNNSSFPPLLCLFLFGIIQVFIQENKVTSILIVAMSLIYWKMENFSLILLSSMCGYSIGMAIVFSFKKMNKKKAKLDKKNGSKSSLSMPFVSKRLKGKLIESYEEAMKVMSPGKKYILRSNISSIEEMAMGGLYESHIIEKEKSKEAMMEHFNSSNQKVNYWIMPYIEFYKTGVVESISDRRLSFIYSLGNAEDVTMGRKSEIKYGSRINPYQKLEKNILKKINLIEKELGYPVHIEIGVKRNLKIEVLQVRPLSSYSIDNWQLSKQNWERIDFSKGSEKGESVIYNLSGGEIIMGVNGTYRRRFSEPLKSVSEINKILIMEIGNFINKYETTKKDTESLVKIVSSRFKPIISAMSSGVIDRSEVLDINISRSLISAIKEFHEKNGIIENYDIESDLIKNHEIEIKEEEISYRDSINIMMIALITWIKINSNDLKESREVEEKEIKKLKVIVNGDLSGKRVSMSEFMSLGSKEKEKSIIVTKNVPVTLIREAMKAKGVILREGSPMSHFCLSAKSNQVPCAIEI